MPKAYAEQAICHEGYGPGGAAVMIACAPASEADDAALKTQVRATLQRHGGSSGAANSVAYLFHRIGVLVCRSTGRLAATAFAAGAEDVLPQTDGTVEIITDPQDLDAIRLQLESAGHAVMSAAVTRRASQSLTLGVADGLRMQQLINDLRALSGVTNVYTNGQIPEQLLARV